ncbi:sugar phosphate isomerase/epimerase [Sinomonas sp. ASV486]|uniref:sugar phosphate isomerase/epimerase family protein n=1 Tax=Sinomonas sp. ASV486 TaxID=3051170 RepID=UPI0027DE41E7|nr:sugar phosphate isomerase/epimerase [Sinomonas sp. ASV486]MDQ4491608.1 sugar phosphate isomerase/epimerase [Sinomonas sp. ASV486]
MFHDRLGCSSISFRHLPLADALRTMAGLGFEEIDLGALPGVCDHVPYGLTDADIDEVAASVAESGLRVRSVNGDIGDLNAVLEDALDSAHDAGALTERAAHLDRLLTLTRTVGARALVLPCGALSPEPVRTLDDDLDLVAAQLAAAGRRAAAFGVELWTESLHYYRLCGTLDRALALADRLEGTGVRHVVDLSHVVASGSPPEDAIAALAGRAGNGISHVHLRDAVPGNINLSIGNGAVDFAGALAALRETGFDGHFSLELEAHDLTHDERPAAAAKAASFITDLI